MDLYGAAKDSLKALSPAARKALAAYASGVNAWLEQAPPFFSSKLPPEFVILRHRPEPWTAADTLVTIKMMSVQLAENLGDEIDRLALARQGLDGREIDDLLPPLGSRPSTRLARPWKAARVSCPAEDAGGRRQASAARPLPVSKRRPAPAPPTTGWSPAAVPGRGKPILANDPHLGLTAPSIWYLADLRVEKEFGEPRNLTGVTLPGTPFVLLGRGSSLAWGFTNTGADVQDVFVEKVDPRRSGAVPHPERLGEVRRKDRDPPCQRRRRRDLHPPLDAARPGAAGHLPQPERPVAGRHRRRARLDRAGP